MPEFKRRRGETASAWHARLTAVDMSRLTGKQLDELTFSRLQAAQAKRRQARRQAQGRNGGADSDSVDLLRCKDAVQALSQDDRRRLVQWIEKHLPE
jgi:hypothetical protein